MSENGQRFMRIAKSVWVQTVGTALDDPTVKPEVVCKAGSLSTGSLVGPFPRPSLEVSGLNVQSGHRENPQQHRGVERCLYGSGGLKIEVWDMQGVRANFPIMERVQLRLRSKKHFLSN